MRNNPISYGLVNKPVQSPKSQQAVPTSWSASVPNRQAYPNALDRLAPSAFHSDKADKQIKVWSHLAKTASVPSAIKYCLDKLDKLGK